MSGTVLHSVALRHGNNAHMVLRCGATWRGVVRSLGLLSHCWPYIDLACRPQRHSNNQARVGPPPGALPTQLWDEACNPRSNAEKNLLIIAKRTRTWIPLTTKNSHIHKATNEKEKNGEKQGYKCSSNSPDPSANPRRWRIIRNPNDLKRGPRRGHGLTGDGG